MPSQRWVDGAGEGGGDARWAACPPPPFSASKGVGDVPGPQRLLIWGVDAPSPTLVQGRGGTAGTALAGNLWSLLPSGGHRWIWLRYCNGCAPPPTLSCKPGPPPHTAPWGSRATKEAVPIQPQRICALRGGEEPNRGCVPPHPPTRPSHAHLPDEAVGGGVRRGAAIRALEAALALAVLALQRGVTGLGGALWASLPRHPQQHRFRTEHRELLRSAPPAATTQHPQTPTHQSGGGGQDALGGRGGGAGPTAAATPPLPSSPCHPLAVTCPSPTHTHV